MRSRTRGSIDARVLATVVVAASFLGSALAAPAGEPDDGKERRGVLARLEAVRREGDGGWVAALERLSESGKTAEFDDSIGARAGVEVELVPRLWLTASVGRSNPSIEVRTLRPEGEPDLVERAQVRMTPVTLGLCYRPREWRAQRFTWSVGAQWARVYYEPLPAEIDADLVSPETSWGLDVRLDIRIARSRWFAGVELGALLPGPRIEDRETGIRRTAHFAGILWAFGLAREF